MKADMQGMPAPVGKTSPGALVHGDNLISDHLHAAMAYLCRRSAALLLALVLLGSCVPAAAFADEGADGTGTEPVEAADTAPDENTDAEPDGNAEAAPDESADGEAAEGADIAIDPVKAEEERAAAELKALEEALTQDAMPYSGAVKITADFLRSEMNLNTAAICGILANIQNESNFDPLAIGDNGTAHGICQWTTKRWDRLLVYCEYHKYEPDTLTAQLQYMKFELETRYPETLKIIRGAKNNDEGADNVARIFCTDYEVPVNINAELAERRKLASHSYWSSIGDLDPKVIPVSQAEAQIITADYLRNEMHLGVGAAAGIMANILAESTFNPLQVGDKNQAYGICQWAGPRLRELKKYCTRNDLNEDDIYAQLSFLKFEMERDYHDTLTLIRYCDNTLEGAQKAAQLFCKNYEVPTNLNGSLKDRSTITKTDMWPLMQTLYSEEIQAEYAEKYEEENRKYFDAIAQAESAAAPHSDAEETPVPEITVSDSDLVSYELITIPTG